MAKLTYDNKIQMNENADIPAVNKGRAVDWNEIKAVVNTNDDNVGDLSDLNTTDKISIVSAINEILDGEVYSTNEIKTNKVWIDNKPIYRQVIEYNSPTLGGKYETYDFSNKSIVYYTCFYQGSDGQFEGIFYNTSTDLFRCLLNINANQIYYKLGTGMGNISKVIVTLYYTKTTD